MKWIMAYQKHREDLAWALQSRVLTDKEMTEVSTLGITLFVQDGQPYYEADKQKQLNEALLQQFRLRAMERHNHIIIESGSEKVYLCEGTFEPGEVCDENNPKVIKPKGETK